MSAWSAVPVYICRAERGWSVSDDAPASTSLGPTVEAVARAVAHAAPHLHRHGDVDGAGDRVDDAAGELRVLEQRRPGARLRHLAHRAAEVDVDDVGAGRLDHPRRLAHRAGIGAEDLDRERMLVGGDPEVAERPLVAVLDAGAADTISEQTRPAPKRRPWRRNACTLTPAIGARTRRVGISTSPIHQLSRRSTSMGDMVVADGCGLDGVTATIRRPAWRSSATFAVPVRRTVPVSRSTWRQVREGRDPHPRGLREPEAGARHAADGGPPRGRRAHPGRARVRRHRRERRVRRREERAGDARAQDRPARGAARSTRA